MSNPLSARRVMFQNIDEKGNPIGEPTYGVIVSDDHEMDVVNTFNGVVELNNAIEEQGCIAFLSDKFKPFVSSEKVGTDNFYGKDWED